MNKSAIRDAATTVLHRNINGEPHVLMGQRGANAAFMPSKFVFPGGAVDQTDYGIPQQVPLSSPCLDRLEIGAETELAQALLACAIRELWEESGLVIGGKGSWQKSPPESWKTYADAGFVPSVDGFTYVFRAITPPGRPRRFDARFFLISSEKLSSDPDDFSNASDELSHLQWIPITRAKDLDLPFITEVVLAEVSQLLRKGLPPNSVPFFKNSDEEALFLRINS